MEVELPWDLNLRERKDVIEVYEQAKRQELADKEKAELLIQGLDTTLEIGDAPTSLYYTNKCSKIKQFAIAKKYARGSV
jgi:hypothetical protein